MSTKPIASKISSITPPPSVTEYHFQEGKTARPKQATAPQSL